MSYQKSVENYKVTVSYSIINIIINIICVIVALFCFLRNFYPKLDGVDTSPIRNGRRTRASDLEKVLKCPQAEILLLKNVHTNFAYNITKK